MTAVGLQLSSLVSAALMCNCGCSSYHSQGSVAAVINNLSRPTFNNCCVAD